MGVAVLIITKANVISLPPQSVLASGVIKDGSAAFTKIIRVAQFLASTPVLRPRPMHTEPPVPTTYGFWVDPVQHYDYEPRDRWILRAGAGVAEDWTWETKVREVGWLLDGMEQVREGRAFCWFRFVLIR